MASLFGSNSNTPVVMTEVHAQSIVNAVVEAVALKAKDGVLETYRQLARLESELAEERRTTSRQTGEIINLQAHIAQLNSVISTLGARPAHGHSLPQAPTGFTQTGYLAPPLGLISAPAPNHSEAG